MDRKITILVVDDEITIRKTVEKLLNRDGYKVLTAENGYEAVKAVENEFIDMVITDVNMPGIDGIETIKRIKEISPKLKIMIMTGMETTTTLIEAIRIGVNDYIYKPFEVEEFRHRIKKNIEVMLLEDRNRRLEEESVRNYKRAAIGDMTNSIVHDIKNSMTVIIGFSKLLKKEDLEKEKFDEFIDIILRQSEGVIGQLREVLDFARGDGSYNFELESVLSFYKDIKNDNCDTYNIDRVDIEFSFDEELKNKSVVIDKQRIKQAIVNLLSNAKDALMGKEDKRIEVTFKMIDEDLMKIGFTNPLICPVSSYAGVLAKKVIFKEEKTEDELDDYEFLSRKFGKEEYDLSKHYPSRIISAANKLKDSFMDKYPDEMKLLFTSGLLCLEHIILGEVEA